MNLNNNCGMQSSESRYCPTAVGSNPPPQQQQNNAVVVDNDASASLSSKVIQQGDVTIHDVLLGRGRGPNMHPGNQRYREIIYANRDNYNKASNRTEQTRITREIVNHIKQQGRFLKRLETPKNSKKKKKRGEANADAWVEVSDATARLKVGQCLRYKLRQDAEDKDDSSEGEIENHKEDKNKEPEAFSGGAIIPSMEKSNHNISMNNSNNINNVIVEVEAAASAEPIVSLFEQQQQAQQQAVQASRKFRKVEVKEEQEPALTQEELEVLKSIGRSGLVLDNGVDNNFNEIDDDDDSFDGFLESSALWEARPTHSNALCLVEDEDEPVPREFTMGSYYDNMFESANNNGNNGGGGGYDSNYAYGTDIISDAEVLSALGYPQAPPAPTARPPVLCHCGCRVDPSEAAQHRHKCGPRRGIYAGSNSFAQIKQRRDALSASSLEEKQPSLDFCSSVIEPMSLNNANSNNSSNLFAEVGAALTPIDESWANPAPIQSDLPQSSSGGMMSTPFHVPESAPMARPRMYRRPFMPSQNAF